MTCASTLPTHTAMPSRQAGPRRGLRATARRRVRRVGRSAPRPCRGRSRGSRVERGQELRRRVVPVLADRPCSPAVQTLRRTRAGQLPDDPVRRLDPVLGPRVDLRVLFEHLQRLGELPLRGDLAAVTRDPRLAAFVREGVDPVGVRLGGMVLPQLDIGVRPVARTRPARTAACRRRASGSTVQAVKSVPIAMMPSGSNAAWPRSPSGRPTGARRGSRPGSATPSPAASGRPVDGQGGLDDTVRVRVHGGAEFGAVLDPDDEGAPGEGAEIDADYRVARPVTVHNHRPGPRWAHGPTRFLRGFETRSLAVRMRVFTFTKAYVKSWPQTWDAGGLL